MGEHLPDLLARQHLGDHEHPVAARRSSAMAASVSAFSSGGVGGAGEQHQLQRRVEREPARSRCGTPFCRVIRPTKAT